MDKLLTKLRLYDTVSPEEERALAAAATETRHFARGEAIVREGEELTLNNLVSEGLAHRFKDMSDGRRQSMEIGVAGDFLDLHGMLMKRIDHDVAALTDCKITFFPHERLIDITASHPHLARMLWLMTIIDAAIHREWIMSLGVRSALQRTAHLFCELSVRLRAVGLAEENRFEMPLIQQQLAEILGMTQVHVNRTLRQLREEGLVTLSGRVAEIHDWARLADTAEFDAGYLGMEHRPR